MNYQKGDRAKLSNFNQIGTSFNITGFGTNPKLEGNSLSHTQYQKWPAGDKAKMEVGLKKDLRGKYLLKKILFIQGLTSFWETQTQQALCLANTMDNSYQNDL